MRKIQRTVAATHFEFIQDKYFAHYSLEDVIATKRLVDHTKLHVDVRAAVYTCTSLEHCHCLFPSEEHNEMFNKYTKAFNGPSSVISFCKKCSLYVYSHSTS